MADMVKAAPYDWPYDGAIDPSKMVLLIIDMQHDFCDKGGYVDLMGYDISQTARTIAPIKAVLDTLRRIPEFMVIYTREGHRRKSVLSACSASSMPGCATSSCRLSAMTRSWVSTWEFMRGRSSPSFAKAMEPQMGADKRRYE